MNNPKEKNQNQPFFNENKPPQTRLTATPAYFSAREGHGIEWAGHGR